MSELNELFEILKEFTNVPSVVGYEDEFRSYLNNKLKETNRETEITEKGLLVVKANDELRDHYTCCHIDREGFVMENNKILYATQFFSHKFKKESCEIIGKRFIDKEIEIGNKKNIISNFRIIDQEIEFLLKEEMDLNGLKEKSVPITKEVEFDGNYVIGQMDNVISVAVLYYLIKKNKVKGNVVFSISEEIGLSGKLIMDYLNSINIRSNHNLLVLDTTPFYRKDNLGDEICLRKRDNRGIYSEEKTKILSEICDQLNISYIYKDEFIKNKNIARGIEKFTYGVTELGTIIKSSQGSFNGTALQLPTINIINIEKVSIEALKNYILVLEKYFKKVI